MFFHVPLICYSISRISQFHLFSNFQTIQRTQTLASLFSIILTLSPTSAEF